MAQFFEKVRHMATKTPQKTVENKSATKGLITERQGKKGISYLVRIRQDGVNQNKTFKEKKVAEQYIRDIQTKIYKTEAVDNEKIKKLTLAEIFNDYVNHVKIAKGKIYSMNQLATEFETVELGKFKSGSFATWLDYKLNQEIPEQSHKKKQHPLYQANCIEVNGKLVKKTYSQGAVRKFYYCIKTALEWHSKHYDYIFESKPFDENKPPKAWANPRERVLEAGELDKLLLACDKLYVKQEETKTMLRFQSYSCMRIGEALLMKWSDIRLNEEAPQDSYIFVPKENQKTKNKEGVFDRKVPLRPEFYNFVKNELFKIKKDKQIYVFGDYWKSSSIVAKQMKIICKNAEIKDLKIHDFRHHSVSWFFINTNLTVIEISRISGHIELETLKRYVTMKHSDIGAKLWNQAKVV